MLFRRNVDGGIKELTREADLNNIVISKEQIVVALEWADPSGGARGQQERRKPPNARHHRGGRAHRLGGCGQCAGRERKRGVASGGAVCPRSVDAAVGVELITL